MELRSQRKIPRAILQGEVRYGTVSCEYEYGYSLCKMRVGTCEYTLEYTRTSFTRTHKIGTRTRVAFVNSNIYKVDSATNKKLLYIYNIFHETGGVAKIAGQGFGAQYHKLTVSAEKEYINRLINTF